MQVVLIRDKRVRMVTWQNGVPLGFARFAAGMIGPPPLVLQHSVLAKWPPLVLQDSLLAKWPPPLGWARFPARFAARGLNYEAESVQIQITYVGEGVQSKIDVCNFLLFVHSACKLQKHTFLT